MRKWTKLILCGVLAVAVVTATELALDFFETSDFSLGAVEPERCEIISAGGAAREVEADIELIPWDWQEGESFRLTWHLPTTDELPELYDDGYIYLAPCASEFIFYIEGDEAFRVANHDDQLSLALAETLFPILPEWAGAEISAVIRPLGADMGEFYNYYMAYTNFKANYGSMYAAGNSNAIPAGGYVTIFLLVFFLFLASLFTGKPDWSLLVLSIMAGLTSSWYLVNNFGYFFLPERVLGFYNNFGPIFAVLALAVLYLFLNRQKGFWKSFGVVVLTAAVLAAGVYLCLLAAGSAKAEQMRFYFTLMLHGDTVLLVIVPYFTIVCGAITVYGRIKQSFIERSESQAMSVRQNMLSDSYRAIEQRFSETAMLRHDWKNQITTLNLLYQQGEMEKLGQRLRELDSSVDGLRLPIFSECFIINALLQNASVRADREGIEFRASAPLPEQVGMDEGDMCSFFINMLDNAIEAASKVPEGKKRFIDLSVKINQGFLAVCCRNSCQGDVELEGGMPETTKAPGEGHGLGLRQMEQIARRYGSKLDLSCDGGVFTVQTALKLKKAPKKAPATAGAE